MLFHLIFKLLAENNYFKTTEDIKLYGMPTVIGDKIYYKPYSTIEGARKAFDKCEDKRGYHFNITPTPHFRLTYSCKASNPPESTCTQYLNAGCTASMHIKEVVNKRNGEIEYKPVLLGQHSHPPSLHSQPVLEGRKRVNDLLSEPFGYMLTTDYLRNQVYELTQNWVSANYIKNKRSRVKNCADNPEALAKYIDSGDFIIRTFQIDPKSQHYDVLFCMPTSAMTLMYHYNHSIYIDACYRRCNINITIFNCVGRSSAGIIYPVFSAFMACETSETVLFCLRSLFNICRESGIKLPESILVDKSQASLSSLRSLQQNEQFRIVLCYFHVYKAMNERLQRENTTLTSTVLEKYLQQLLNETTPDSFEEARKALFCTEKLEDYYNDTWKPISEYWRAKYIRKERWDGSTTTNSVESHHRAMDRGMPSTCPSVAQYLQAIDRKSRTRLSEHKLAAEKMRKDNYQLFLRGEIMKEYEPVVGLLPTDKLVSINNSKKKGEDIPVESVLQYHSLQISRTFSDEEEMSASKELSNIGQVRHPKGKEIKQPGRPKRRKT